MRIVITGASGFIGRTLCERLLASGHELLLLGRAPKKGLPAAALFSTWNPEATPAPATALDGADAIIHLAGEPVGQRWTGEVKRRIRNSRVAGTENLVKTIAALDAKQRPKVLLSASAIGYYGEGGSLELNEKSPAGKGFLAEVTKDWEAAAMAAQPLGLRVVTLRTGVVLGTHGGALDRMLPIFRMGLGGRIGSGEQWMSWIHAEDVIGLIEFALGVAQGNSKLTGPLNLTAPEPATNAQFTAALAKALGRPAMLPVPALALRLLFGEMSEVLTASQRVLPAAALKAGYKFRYPKLAKALDNILV